MCESGPPGGKDLGEGPIGTRPKKRADTDEIFKRHCRKAPFGDVEEAVDEVHTKNVSRLLRVCLVRSHGQKFVCAWDSLIFRLLLFSENVQ